MVVPPRSRLALLVALLVALPASSKLRTTPDADAWSFDSATPDQAALDAAAAADGVTLPPLREGERRGRSSGDGGSPAGEDGRGKKRAGVEEAG